MRTGFAQAYARIVTQQSQDQDDGSDSSYSGNGNFPVDPSDDEDNFADTPNNKGGKGLTKHTMTLDG